MAQASTVQREPSMEEILASIRRIIEDNDGGRKPGDADSLAIPRPANQDQEEASFRAELRGSLDRAAEQRPAPALKAVEPVAEELAAPALKAVEPAVEKAVTPAPSRFAVQAEPAEADAVSVALARFDLAAEIVDEVANEPRSVAQDAQEPVKPTSEPLDQHDAPVPEMSEDRAAEPARSAILSAEAGRQVAAAFGELSEVVAVAARPRRSFDEIAQQMLRPMLQEWLDDNLPTLVERLVREEIERVARGG